MVCLPVVALLLLVPLVAANSIILEFSAETNDAIDDAVTEINRWVGDITDRQELAQALNHLGTEEAVAVFAGSGISSLLYSAGTDQVKFKEIEAEIGADKLMYAARNATRDSSYVKEVLAAVGSDFSVNNLAAAFAQATTKDNIQGCSCPLFQ